MLHAEHSSSFDTLSSQLATIWNLLTCFFYDLLDSVYWLSSITANNSLILVALKVKSFQSFLSARSQQVAALQARKGGEVLKQITLCTLKKKKKAYRSNKTYCEC